MKLISIIMLGVLLLTLVTACSKTTDDVAPDNTINTNNDVAPTTDDVPSTTEDLVDPEQDLDIGDVI